MKYVFGGHEKFECKSDWVSKFLIEYLKDNEILHKDIDTVIARLGLGKNMIGSLKYWLRHLGIYDGDLSEFGEIVKENDIFLESKNTLMLMHYHLCKTPTIYNLFFNRFFYLKFKKEKLILDLSEFNVSQNTIANDIDTFIRLYTQGIFRDLNFFEKEEYISLNIGMSVDDNVFLYALYDVFEMKNQISMSVYDLEKGDISLLQIFAMDENSFFNKINKIEKISNSAIEYRESSGFKTLYLKEKLNKNEILRNCVEI